MKNIVFFLLISTLYTQDVKTQTYENLVFEGAGIRGIAYSGVLNELEENKVLPNVKKVGGTSAGAITALMVSLGYTSKEISDIISDTKFEKFNDGEYFFIGGFSRLNSKYGWYKGEEFDEWLGKIILIKTGNKDITFSGLKNNGFRQLYVTATCLNKQKLLVFSDETYPSMKVKDAIRISMSIPLYFEAVFIDSVGRVHDKNDVPHLDVVVDGGIIGNFPIFIFDSLYQDASHNIVRIPNSKTLGIRIDTDVQIRSDSASQGLATFPINNMNDYLEAFYNLVIENLNRTPLIPADWERTISVSSVGIGPRIKKLTKEQKAALVKSGSDSTKKYFRK